MSDRLLQLNLGLLTRAGDMRRSVTFRRVGIPDSSRKERQGEDVKKPNSLQRLTTIDSGIQQGGHIKKGWNS